MNKALKAYFDSIPEIRKPKIDAIHALIIKLFPDCNVSMKYKMPTYQLGEGWAALANQKNHVSLYTCGAHHLAAFKQKHPQIKTGKGCINFSDKDDIPVSDVEGVIEHAIKHPKGGK